METDTTLVIKEPTTIIYEPLKFWFTQPTLIDYIRSSLLFYGGDMIMENDHYINGYQLYDYNVNYSIHDDLIDKYNDTTEMTYEEFYDEFSIRACTDWGEMDDNGIYFANDLKYPEESEQYKNTFNLTFEDNCKKLYKLPFSHKLILWSVQYGYYTGNESVRFSNCYCELVKRKINKYQTGTQITINFDKNDS
jgi:hypothetical protein